MLSYPIEFTAAANAGADAVMASCPDIPEVAVAGDDRQDALAKAVGALEAAIAVRMAFHDDIPNPSAGADRVDLPTQSAIKIRLYQATRDSGITKRELGRRLQWHGPQVDRLFKLRHASRINQLEAAFNALGLQLNVAVQTSAADGR